MLKLTMNDDAIIKAASIVSHGSEVCRKVLNLLAACGTATSKLH